MKQETLSTLGEFGIISLIKKRFNNISDKNVIVPIGDDAFSFKSGGKIISITKDILIENVHFKKKWISPFDLGKKSIEINISDLAAMGAAEPKYIFIGLGLPKKTQTNFIEEFSKGVYAACKKYGAQLCGGDTVRAAQITISVTAAGFSKKIIKRSGAQEGDLIGVTNFCGDSAAGLNLLYKKGAKGIFNKDERYLIARHNNPQARLKESGIISNFAHSMTDSSDGLYFSVYLLTEESKKGADIFIDKIPVSAPLKRTVKDKNKLLSLSLSGAEDFEIVFTVSLNNSLILKRLLPQISFIGRINSKKGINFIDNGKKVKLNIRGFKHF